MNATRIHDESASLTVELVVLTPVLFVFVLMAVAFGRITGARQQVIGAARAGAQSAAVMSDGQSAARAAPISALAGIIDQKRTCIDARVSTDVSHFYPGGFVVVTVACRVELSDLSIPGIPGTTTVSASSTAPIDPFRPVS